MYAQIIERQPHNGFARSHAARIAAVMPPPAPKRKAALPPLDKCAGEFPGVWRSFHAEKDGTLIEGTTPRVFLGDWDSHKELAQYVADEIEGLGEPQFEGEPRRPSYLRQESESDRYPGPFCGTCDGMWFTMAIERIDDGRYQGPFQVQCEGAYFREFQNLATALTEADAVLGFSGDTASVLAADGTEIATFRVRGHRLPKS